MTQILQAFRIGVVNLFGITVPGFLLLFFTAFGLVIPVLNIALHISKTNWDGFLDFYQKNEFVIFAITLIVSYVAGFILRLSSPDELDQVSGRIVLDTFDNPEEKAVWPFTGEPGDKFPYFRFYDYLKARALTHLLPFVTWGPDHDKEQDKQKDAPRTKRSKTAVNVLKLEIMEKNADLSAMVESNEAHIRLMSGTWLAIKTTLHLVNFGIILTIIAAIISYVLQAQQSVENTSPLRNSPHYLVILVTIVSLRIIMKWAKSRIEGLFHYRRVSELLFIVQAAHIVSKKIQSEQGNQK